MGNKEPIEIEFAKKRLAFSKQNLIDSIIKTQREINRLKTLINIMINVAPCKTKRDEKG